MSVGDEPCLCGTDFTCMADGHERMQRYVDAIYGEQWDGLVSERAVRAVMAVADAEQAELRDEVSRPEGAYPPVNGAGGYAPESWRA